ncbi:MAG: transcription antitermination factor NusB, partial [bacterium]
MSSSYPPRLPASPRNHAYRALRTLSRPDVFCDEALHDLLDREPLSQRDAALATSLVQGVLRRRTALDALLSKVPGFQYSRAAAPLCDVLRLALFQKHFLERIPDHAIVHESVELTRAVSGERAASFTNAFLRKMLAAFAHGAPELHGKNERETLSLRESMPK